MMRGFVDNSWGTTLVKSVVGNFTSKPIVQKNQ